MDNLAMQQRKKLAPLAMLYKVERKIEMIFAGNYGQVEGKQVPYLGTIKLVTEFGDDYEGEIRDYLPYQGKGKWINLRSAAVEDGDVVNSNLQNGFVRSCEIQDNPISKIIKNDDSIPDIYKNSSLVYNLEIKNSKKFGTTKIINPDTSYVQLEFLDNKKISTVEKKIYKGTVNGYFEGETKNGVETKGKMSFFFSDSAIKIDGILDNNIFTGKLIYEDGAEFDGILQKEICCVDVSKLFPRHAVDGKIVGKGTIKFINSTFIGSVTKEIADGKMFSGSKLVFEGELRNFRPWKGKADLLIIGGNEYTGDIGEGILVSGHQKSKNNNGYNMIGTKQNGRWFNANGTIIDKNTHFIGNIKNGVFFDGIYEICIGLGVIYSGTRKDGKHENVLECKHDVNGNYLLSKYENGAKVIEKQISAGDYNYNYGMLERVIPKELIYREHLINRFQIYLLFSNARILCQYIAQPQNQLPQNRLPQNQMPQHLMPQHPMLPYGARNPSNQAPSADTLLASSKTIPVIVSTKNIEIIGCGAVSSDFQQNLLKDKETNLKRKSDQKEEPNIPLKPVIQENNLESLSEEYDAGELTIVSESCDEDDVSPSEQHKKKSRSS